MFQNQGPRLITGGCFLSAAMLRLFTADARELFSREQRSAIAVCAASKD